MLGREFDYFKNWGQAGGGNSFIFYSLIECVKREQITSQDTMIIMWTSIGREDRYIRNRRWLTPGSIYGQTIYDKSFVEQFADPTGYLLRDMAHVTAAKKILESIGCKFYFLSTVPLTMYDDNIDDRFSIDNQIVKLYQEEIDCIMPSVYTVVFNEDWYSRPGYVNKIEVETEYRELAGADWPSWKQFVQGNIGNVSTAVKKELALYDFNKRLTVRSDTHPVPLEHLEYIQHSIPELTVSNSTQQLVKQTTEQILEHKTLNKWWINNQIAERF
jgi:hypothetical protein